MNGPCVKYILGGSDVGDTRVLPLNDKMLTQATVPHDSILLWAPVPIDMSSRRVQGRRRGFSSGGPELKCKGEAVVKPLKPLLSLEFCIFNGIAQAQLH